MRRSAAAPCALLLAAAPLAAQRPLNLGMERPSVVQPGTPAGWYMGQNPWEGPGSGVALDSAVAREGRRSLRVTRAPGGPAASWWASLPTAGAPHSGKRIRLSGWVRTEALRGGEATLRLDQFGPGWRPLRTDTMPARGLRGTAGWTRLQLEVVADTGLYMIGAGAQVSGTGTAWIDGLRLEVDGRPVTVDPAPPPPTAAEVAWLRARSAPFATHDPAAARGVADLDPLGRIVGGAAVVSLGEATHGTREHFQAKHRIWEYLVRRMGFRVLMLEANQLAAERINRYVQTGEGDPRALLGGLFQVLRTEEVRALVEWTRALNASGAGRVEIVGFDMQDPQLPIDSVRAFLARADPAFAPAADSAYADFREAWRARAYPTPGDSASAAWERGAERVRRHVEGRRAAYLAVARTAADSAAVAWAVQNATVAHEASRLRQDEASVFRRDSAMAQNVAWALAQRPAGTRAAVWGHNMHVSRTPRWMGAHLERLVPGGVRVFALTSAEGVYRAAVPGPAAAGARPFAAFPIDPAPPSGIAHALAGFGGDHWIADLRGAAADPAGRWTAAERPFLSAGGAGVDDPYAMERVGEVYDAVVFVRRSTPARPLDAPPP